MSFEGNYKIIFVHEVNVQLNVLFASQHFEMLCNGDNRLLLHPITNMTFLKKTTREHS